MGRDEVMGGRGPAREPEDRAQHGHPEEGEQEEAAYPPRTEEDHVAGAREPLGKEAVEPETEGTHAEDRSRMSDIMRRVNDALHRVRPKENRER